ncbi:MAG: hypothetical protein EXR97_00135 [Nitrospiraceae bacterium]|nr:hypothetical protein [Nitrospiraceae bacterium]MSR24018.1 hypothetical protein [Nitrospiraceae bacterium]
MYLWKTSALAEDLNGGRVSQLEKMKYLIMFTLLSSCAFDMLLWWFAEESEPIRVAYEMAFWPVGIALIIGGTRLCYQANLQGDGREFLDRFVCLNCPIFIRLGALTVAAFSIYLTIGFSLEGSDFDPFPESHMKDLAFNIFSIVFQLLYFWRVRHHLLKISYPIDESNPLSPSATV